MKLDKQLHIRMQASMLHDIGKQTKIKLGTVSKNTWILHAIQEKLEREKKK